MTKSMAKLEGNVVEHMRLIADLKEQKQKHFHFDSKLWKAIRDSIGKEGILVDHPEECLLMTHRGTGHAISLNSVHLFGKNYEESPPVEQPTFFMEVEVEYVREDDTHMDHPPTFTRKTPLNVPVTLAIDFQQEQFDLWVAKLKNRKEQEQQDAELAQLRELVKKYPSQSRELALPKA